MLDTFPNDVEGWAELTDLYLSQGMLSQAAFCLEELILLQPFSHYVHAQYAEVLWALGKEATALKYWSRSVELCSDFLRGWFGVKNVESLLFIANTQATKKALANMQNGNKKELVIPGDEAEKVPSAEILKKLDLLSTAKLMELKSKGTSGEQKAIKALIET